MNTEEKLKHFLDTCMKDARARSSRMLNEYTSSLEKSFEEHKQEARRHSQNQIRQETEQIDRDINRQLSAAQLELKRMLGKRQDELKDQLFAELGDRLLKYRKTPEYEKLLEHQIDSAVRFADGRDILVWLDPDDKDLLPALSGRFPQAELKLSDYSFSGGTRAIISSGKLLIDNSFQVRLTEMRESFYFNPDPKKLPERSAD